MIGQRNRLPAAEARALAEAAARRLAGDPRVRLVYLHGSAADPAAASVSDVDLAVQAEPPLDAREILSLRTDLERALAAPIDLVSLDRASIVLAREIADHGVCLHADPPDAETDFVVRARRRHLDFKYFLDEQWRLTGERLTARQRRREAAPADGPPA